MGLIICGKHGEAGIVNHLSKDICDEILKTKNNIREIYVIKVDVFDGDEYLYTEKNYISKMIFEDYNLKNCYVIRKESDEKELNNILPETCGVCEKCFKEYLADKHIIV